MNPKYPSLEMYTGRRCGECAECCTYFAIPSLEKPENTHCCNETVIASGTKEAPIWVPGRCSIYETRPEECSSFKCAWLGGIGREVERPDKLGIIPVLWGGDADGDPENKRLVLYEVIKGAWHTEAAKLWFSRISKSTNQDSFKMWVYLIYWGESPDKPMELLGVFNPLESMTGPAGLVPF